MGQAKKRVELMKIELLKAKLKKKQQEIEYKEKQLARIKEKQNYLNSLSPEERQSKMVDEIKIKSLLACAYGMSNINL